MFADLDDGGGRFVPANRRRKERDLLLARVQVQKQFEDTAADAAGSHHRLAFDEHAATRNRHQFTPAGESRAANHPATQGFQPADSAGQSLYRRGQGGGADGGGVIPVLQQGPHQAKHPFGNELGARIHHAKYGILRGVDGGVERVRVTTLLLIHYQQFERLAGDVKGAHRLGGQVVPFGAFLGEEVQFLDPLRAGDVGGSIQHKYQLVLAEMEIQQTADEGARLGGGIAGHHQDGHAGHERRFEEHSRIVAGGGTEQAAEFAGAFEQGHHGCRAKHQQEYGGGGQDDADHSGRVRHHGQPLSAAEHLACGTRRHIGTAGSCFL